MVTSSRFEKRYGFLRILHPRNLPHREMNTLLPRLTMRNIDSSSSRTLLPLPSMRIGATTRSTLQTIPVRLAPPVDTEAKISGSAIAHVANDGGAARQIPPASAAAPARATKDIPTGCAALTEGDLRCLTMTANRARCRTIPIERAARRHSRRAERRAGVEGSFVPWRRLRSSRARCAVATRANVVDPIAINRSRHFDWLLAANRGSSILLRLRQKVLGVL
mmetsp:Transcript_43595/g.92678  ORF Transcript_43595/g.92678 Transcript_43595/m.92678 type:complete len:221 (-) Transcript_43595:25-687(-)